MDLELTNVATQPVKQSMFHPRLLLCWLLSEDLSHPSVILQVLQMTVVHGVQMTCRLDRINHKVEIGKAFSALSLHTWFDTAVHQHTYVCMYQHITMILYISKGIKMVEAGCSPSYAGRQQLLVVQQCQPVWWQCYSEAVFCKEAQWSGFYLGTGFLGGRC